MAFVEIRSVARPAASPQDWSTVPRKISYICWLCAGFLGIIASIMAYGQYLKMNTWVPVEATVTKNDIYWDYSRNAKGGNSIVYGARFTFSYIRDGHEQTGVADLGYRSGYRSWIERQAKTLPVGAHRQVRANPDDLRELSLASDFGELSFASAYFASSVAMLVFAIGLALWWWSVILVESRQRRDLFAAAR